MEWDDQAALRSLAERYARGIDRRDAEVFVQVFWPDAVLSVFNPSEADEPRAVLRGHEELAKVTELITAYAKTYHFLGNAVYDVTGDEATGEVYCIAHHLTPSRHGGTDYVMLIRYQDEYRRAHGEWKIVDRRVLVDWTELRTVNRAGR